MKVEHLYNGDMRCQTLEDAIIDLIYERAVEMPYPTVIGILRLVEKRLIEDLCTSL